MHESLYSSILPGLHQGKFKVYELPTVQIIIPTNSFSLAITQPRNNNYGMGDTRREIVSRVRSYRLYGGRGRATTTRTIVKKTQIIAITKFQLSQRLWSAWELGVAAEKRTVKVSHWAYWIKFCGIWEVDVFSFRSMVARTDRENGLRLENELDTLSVFASFRVFAHRNNDKGRFTNSVNYSEQVISSVSVHYAVIHGGRRGITDWPLEVKQLVYTLNGLRKFAPKEVQVKHPILQAGLRRVKTVMNLRDSHMDSTRWVLWLLQWKGVMRSGDVI